MSTAKHPPTPINTHGTQLKSIDHVAHRALVRNQDERNAANKSVYRYTMPTSFDQGDYGKRMRENEAIQRIKSRGLHKGGANFEHEDILG